MWKSHKNMIGLYVNNTSICGTHRLITEQGKDKQFEFSFLTIVSKALQ